jgi:branched-chain amino acid transport system ATP-binding protein
MTAQRMSFLDIEGLTMRFGGLTAIDNLSMSVPEGEIRGLIGPNGAGKTTLFNAISGRYRTSGGEIRFRDRVISNLKPHLIVAHGLARTFQHVTLFSNFSVVKNVMAGCHLHSGQNFWSGLLGTPAYRRAEAANEARAREILDFVGLGGLADETAANLPHGSQRAVGIAIALAAEPQLLLLDEPCAGMNVTETAEMMNLIRRISANGTSVMLIEHDMKFVMGLCDRITVLNFGIQIAEGTAQEVLADPLVHEAYLGGSPDVS